MSTFKEEFSRELTNAVEIITQPGATNQQILDQLGLSWGCFTYEQLVTLGEKEIALLKHPDLFDAKDFTEKKI